MLPRFRYAADSRLADAVRLTAWVGLRFSIYHAHKKAYSVFSSLSSSCPLLLSSILSLHPLTLCAPLVCCRPLLRCPALNIHFQALVKLFLLVHPNIQLYIAGLSCCLFVRSCLVAFPAALLIPARAAGSAFTRSRSILLRVSSERSRAHFLFFPLRGVWVLLFLSLAAGRACLLYGVALGALLCASDPPLLRFHLRRHICVSTPLYYYAFKFDRFKSCFYGRRPGQDRRRVGGWRCLVMLWPVVQIVLAHVLLYTIFDNVYFYTTDETAFLI